MRRWIGVALLSAALAVGCGNDSNDFVVGGVHETPSAVETPVQDHGPLAQILPQRKLITRAAVSLRVSAIGTAVEKIRERTQQLGGFVGRASSNEATEATLEVRIPAARLDEFLTTLPTLGTVLAREAEGEDVTAKAVDLDSNLRNLRATEERLRAILKRSGSITDVLTVEKELARVRGEIEEIQGQRDHLEDLVAYSTVTVRLFHQTVAVKPVQSFWDLSGTVSHAWNVARYCVRGLLKVTIYAVVLLPLTLPAALWLGRKRKARPQSPTGPSGETGAPRP